MCKSYFDLGADVDNNSKVDFKTYNQTFSSIQNNGSLAVGSGTLTVAGSNNNLGAFTIGTGFIIVNGSLGTITNGDLGTGTLSLTGGYSFNNNVLKGAGNLVLGGASIVTVNQTGLTAKVTINGTLNLRGVSKLGSEELALVANTLNVSHTSFDQKLTGTGLVNLNSNNSIFINVR